MSSLWALRKALFLSHACLTDMPASFVPLENKSVAGCSPTTPHLHSPKEVALVGAFCTPSALNLGDPVSFSRNTSHIDRVGQRSLSDTCLQSNRALGSHLHLLLQVLPAVMLGSLDLSSLALK